SAIEEKLIQVKMKSSEGNLVYPNELNEEFYTFTQSIEADTAPTQPQEEVFKQLAGQLEEQLKAWTQITTDDVPKVNALVKQADLPALTVASAAPPNESPTPKPTPTAPTESPAPTASPTPSAKP
ncbi:MAG TPA: hypothetical protein VNW28_06650, partial [Chthoniobacterales bacterium]|nr:hypothetical protein [Chthoniobacterales bacterium]